MASSITPSSMLAIASVMPALSILAVGLRFYVRVSKRQGLKADDWLIIPALLMVIGLGILIIIGEQQQAVGYTLGAVPEDFLDWGVTFVYQLSWAMFILSSIQLGFAKLSILYFYRRVFVTGSNKVLDIVTKVLAGIIVAWILANVFDTIFFCGTNIAGNWADHVTQTAICANAEAENYFYFISDVILDVILLVLPIPLILSLQMSNGRRAGIVLVFLVGSLAVIASIIRLVIVVLIYSDSGYDFVGQDPLICNALIFYWTIFEGGFSVITACLPCLQVWFRKVSVEGVTRNVRKIFSLRSFPSYSRSRRGDDLSKDSNHYESKLRKGEADSEVDSISGDVVKG